MKKNIMIIMMAFAALLMTQCKKQAEQQTMEPTGATMEVKVRVENAADKTEITPTGVVSWKEGDRIYVVGSEQGVLGFISAKADGDPAIFEGTITALTSPQTLRFYYTTSFDGFWTYDDGSYIFGINYQNGTLERIAVQNQLMFGKTESVVSVGTSDFGTISMTSMIAIAHMNISHDGSAVPYIRVRGGLSTLNFNAKEYNGEPLTGTPGDFWVTFNSSAASTDCYIALLPGTQTLHISRGGCEATLDEKTVVANMFYNKDNALQVTMTTPVEGVTDGHSWINFNDQPGENYGVTCLPLWAKYNVGVNESNLTTPESYYGKYYAWGETKAYGETMSGEGAQAGQNYQIGAIKTDFQWTTYKWGNGRENMGKYSLSDGIDILSAEDDAANANWGDSWRMPSGRDYGMLEGGEWSELVENTYFQWVYNYNDIAGLNGFVVYKVKHADDKGLRTIDEEKDADNPVWRTVKGTDTDATLSATYTLADPHMFLPAAGSYMNTYHLSAGYSGQYWSCMLGSLDTEGPDNDLYRAGCMCINPELVDSEWVFARCAGCSVRPVLGVPNAGGNANPFVNKPW